MNTYDPLKDALDLREQRKPKKELRGIVRTVRGNQVGVLRAGTHSLIQALNTSGFMLEPGDRVLLFRTPQDQQWIISQQFTSGKGGHSTIAAPDAWESRVNRRKKPVGEITLPPFMKVTRDIPVESGVRQNDVDIQYDDQNANTVLAAPDGAAGQPEFRALTLDDLPPGAGGGLTSVGITSQMPVETIGSPLTANGNIHLKLVNGPSPGMFVVSHHAAPYEMYYRFIDPNDIPSLDASKITTGIFSTGLIPSLDASHINSGIFSVARIPQLSASKMPAGVYPQRAYLYSIDWQIQNGSTSSIYPFAPGTGGAPMGGLYMETFNDRVTHSCVIEAGTYEIEFAFFRYTGGGVAELRRSNVNSTTTSTTTQIFNYNTYGSTDAFRQQRFTHTFPSSGRYNFRLKNNVANGRTVAFYYISIRKSTE